MSEKMTGGDESPVKQAISTSLSSLQSDGDGFQSANEDGDDHSHLDSTSQYANTQHNSDDTTCNLDQLTTILNSLAGHFDLDQQFQPVNHVDQLQLQVSQFKTSLEHKVQTDIQFKLDQLQDQHQHELDHQQSASDDLQKANNHYQQECTRIQQLLDDTDHKLEATEKSNQQKDQDIARLELYRHFGLLNYRLIY